MHSADAAPTSRLHPATAPRGPLALLPAGQVVDRQTIVVQLMNDPRNPFNRAPMTEADLKPRPDLAQRIQEWREAQRGSRMQE